MTETLIQVELVDGKDGKLAKLTFVGVTTGKVISDEFGDFVYIYIYPIKEGETEEEYKERVLQEKQIVDPEYSTRFERIQDYLEEHNLKSIKVV
jgi:hypothetical protein